MKTLDQLEPRTPIESAGVTITNPGSYYLTGNLTASGSHGIIIQTNNVSLDLKGFTLESDDSNTGVFVNGAYTNITIRNGNIRRWVTGIDSSFSQNTQLDGLLVTHNLFGIVSGQGTVASRCTASFNTQFGLSVSSGCSISQCIARNNGSHGILASSGALIVGCVAESNGDDGISLDRGTVKDCVARGNSGDGIEAFINCMVVGNTCLDNGFNGSGAGIHSRQGGQHIEGNYVSGNDRGIDCNPSTNNLIIRNSASGNAIDFDIAGGNTTGPIVTSVTIATSTNPHANYTH